MDADTATLPRRYGRYQIEMELGRGAMGVVYKAHDPQIDRRVALKVLRRRRTSSERHRQRLLKEAHAIGRLSHPNIVTVFDVGQDHGTVFLAEEYVEGHTLHRQLTDGPLAPATVISLGIQLAQALAYAHNEGIVHRDIKSHNIICQPDGRVKLTDFGIARIEDAHVSEETRPGQIMGTPAFMAPELLSGATADARSDLFSLGVVLYEAATGERPFRGDSVPAIFAAIRETEPPPPHEVNTRMLPQLSEAIMTCLAKQPQDRHQSGDALVAVLRTCLTVLYTGHTGITAPPQHKPRHWLVVLALLSLGLIVGMASWAVMRHKGVLSAVSREIFSKEATVVETAVGIRSEPPGALVIINGQPKGRTPLTLHLIADDYRLRLEATGYYTYDAVLTVDGTRTQPVKVILKPLIF